MRCFEDNLVAQRKVVAILFGHYPAAALRQRVVEQNPWHAQRNRFADLDRGTGPMRIEVVGDDLVGRRRRQQSGIAQCLHQIA